MKFELLIKYILLNFSTEIKLFENGDYIGNLETLNKFWFYHYIYNKDSMIRIDTLYRNLYFSKGPVVSANKIYKMEISAPGIDKQAYIEFKAPALVPIIKIDTMLVYDNESNYGSTMTSTSLQFDLLLQDPPEEENFYAIQLITSFESSYRDQSGQMIYHKNSQYQTLETNDVLLNFSNIYIDQGILFNDNVFNGKLQHIIFKTRFNISGHTVYHVILRNISKDYYNYMASLSSYRNSVDNPIAEPISVKSNVVNGFGIVTAVNQWIDSSIVFN